ncbi:MAG: glycosyltransferase family 4 protein [Leptolyngbya sp. SIO1E4]|nr:glycosyltransferase family 4 protein [Leptolyngbya sp. SIO1E4]
MKIAYATTYDVRNAATWSKFKQGNYGSNRFIAMTLENEGIDIDYLGPLEKRYRWLTRSKWLYHRHISKQVYYSWAETAICKNYAHQFARKLKQSSADLVLATEGANPIAYLTCSQPLVLWVDTFVAELIDYYPYLKNLCAETRKSILTYEKRALDYCALIIVTSDWAKQSAIKHYGIDANKIVILPRGANIELAPGRTLDDVKTLIAARPQAPCKLLFSAISWQRKGGDIAVKVAEWLNEQGLDTELIVLGCKPPLNPLPPFVKAVGYIDKSTEAGRAELLNWVAGAHFLILPTREDCAPNVLIEANAFGVPCLTTNIAGIPTVVRSDVNGEMFDLDAPIEAYGKYVAAYMGDRAAYDRLAVDAFMEYQNRLNWKVVGQQAKAYFEKILRGVDYSDF